MRFFLQLLFSLICVLTSSNSCWGQTKYMYLNQSIVSDGSACTNLDSTHFYCVIYNYFPGSSTYYINANFGDGHSDTIQMNGNGTNIFKLSHVYPSLDTFTLTVSCYDSLFIKTDSVQSLIKIGGCQVAKGSFFFDCNQNCTLDSFEQLLSNRIVSFDNNSVTKSVYIDSSGEFSVPIYPGDSYAPINPLVETMQIGQSCSYNNGTNWNLPPITTGTNTYLVPLVIPNDGTLGLSTPEDTLICKNLFYPFYWGVSHSSSVFNNNYVIEVLPGEGIGSSYASEGNFSGSYPYLYNDTGYFKVKINLYYKPGSGLSFLVGPVMVKERLVHVQNCHPVNVKYYSDVDQNCQQNNSEFTYDMNKEFPNLYSSILNAANPSSSNADGSITTYIRPNDTIYPPPSFSYYNPYGMAWGNNNYYIHARNCLPQYITEADDSVKFAFDAALDIDHVDISNPNYTSCMGDTLNLMLWGSSVGLYANSQLKLIANYNDGTSDTFNFTPALTDSFTYNFKKVVISNNSLNANFTLTDSAHSTFDTLTTTHTIDNCATIGVRTFYDMNKNCVKDSNELYLNNFSVEADNSTNEYSIPFDSITAKLTIFTSDTLRRIKLHTNSLLGSGYYNRDFTTEFCTWPIFAPDTTGIFEVPLIDTVNVQNENLINGTDYWNATSDISYCDSVYHPTLLGVVEGNRNAANSFYFKYNNGDGSSLDSITFSPPDNFSNSSTSYFVSAPNKVYDNGTYIPSYTLIKSLTQTPILNFTSTPITVNFLNCQKPKAMLFLDNNNNCQKESTEMALNNTVVNVLRNGTAINTITNANGFVYFNASNGDQISITAPQTLSSGKSLSTSCLASNTVTYTYNSAATDTLKFPYSCPTGAAVNFSVTAAHNFLIAGQHDTILIYPQQTGCYTGSATLKLSLDPSLTFTTSSLTGQVQNGNTLTWNIANSSTLGSGPIKVAVSLNNPAATGYLCNDITFYPAVADVDSGNNEFMLCDTIFNTIPNQVKTGLTDSVYLQTGVPVVYTVHFHNNTSGNINQIIILDTLSSLLNINSLQVLYATSNYTTQILNNNVIKFTFQAINLPANASGIIQFTLTPTGTVTPGMTVYNKVAVIYGPALPVFSAFAINASLPTTPLQTTLIYFNGKQNGLVNLLTWKTATPKDFINFEIERSADGRIFENIGTVSGNTYTEQTSYTFSDTKPLTGNNLYRLKMKNDNEQSDYSNVVIINRATKDDFKMNIFPNPFRQSFNVVLYGQMEGKGYVTIVDIVGKVIERQTISSNQSTININNLIPGVYFIQYKDDVHSLVSKIVKE